MGRTGGSDMKVFGTVEVSYSIDVPPTITKEELTKYVINAVKNGIKEASTEDNKFDVDKDAEWSMNHS